MRYLIANTTDALYNDDGHDAAPMCIVTVEGERVTDVSSVEGGNPGVVELVKDELERYPDSTLEQIVGMFGVAVAYKPLED